MNSRLTTIITLVLIVFLTLFTRLYKLTSFPPALFSDEVDAGYQAQTLIHNGTDYYGNKLPTHFHSFSDWRTPLQIYSIALIQLFRANPELSVRLPSAVFSIFTVLTIFLLTRSYIFTLLMAISPWAIHFGRTGFEVSGMIFTLTLSLYFWQRYIKNPISKYLIFSLLFLCLAPYFYSTAKLFIVIILFLYLFVWRPALNSKLIYILFGSLFIFLLPLVVDTIQGQAGYRFSYISIFTEPHREQTVDNFRYQDILIDHPRQIGVKTPTLSYIFHNKYQLVVTKFISNYLSAFSTEFLFISGDHNLRQGFGQHGLLYSLDLILLFLGFYQYFKHPTKLGRYFLWLLILSPIPFALTRDSIGPHSTRLILMLPSLLYFISLSVNRYRLSIPIYLILFIGFWHYYINHYPQATANYWHDNYSQAITATKTFSSNNIYFIDSAEPFIPFFLFYYPYLPDDNLQSHLTSVDNYFFSGNSLDSKYFFGHLNIQNIDPNLLQTIFVVPRSTTFSPPPTLKLIKHIPKRHITGEEFDIYSTFDVN